MASSYLDASRRVRRELGPEEGAASFHDCRPTFSGSRLADVFGRSEVRVQVRVASVESHGPEKP